MKEGSLTAGVTRPGRAILVMAVIGVVVRLALAPLTSYPNDDVPWYWMTTSGLQHLPVYARTGFSYPPVWGWVLELVGRVVGELGGSPAALGVHDLTLNGANMATGGALATTITSPLLNVCIKVLLTSADLVTALLLAGLAPAVSNRRRAKELAFGLYFLNPLVINEASVRAGIDGLIALSIVATLSLVVRRRPFLAGVALGIGVFVKLTPLAMAPLVLAALVSIGRRDREGWACLRQAGEFLGGGLAVAVPVLVALGGTGQWSGFVENTFSRTQTGLLIGGPAFGGLRHFAQFSNLLRLADRHRNLTLDISLSIEAVAVIGMSVWTWVHARRSLAHSLVLASTVTFAVVVATTPTSQPGYVLWLLGPLILLASAKPLSYVPFAVVLSVGALVFSLTYYSPAQLLFPLAEYTKALSPADLGATVQHWYLRPTGLWGASYKENYASICAAVAMLFYLFLVARCFDDRDFVPAGESRDEVAAGAGRAPPERAVAGLVAFSLVAMVVSSATPALPPGFAGSKFAVVVPADASFDLTVSSKKVADERSLRVVSFPVDQTSAFRHVFVVVDATMPLGATTLQDVRGVFDDLKATLKLRGYAGPVTMISADGLTRLLSAGPSPDRAAVVDTSGVLPTAVLSPGHDLLVPWLRSGGILYWGGGPIGLWHAAPGQTQPVSWLQGPTTVFGPVPLVAAPRFRQAQHPTPVARALDLQYQDASFWPAAVSPGSLGGSALGYLSPGSSSVTRFSFGDGRLVVFGGLMYANAEVASDISLLQMSEVLYASGPVSVSTEKLSGGGSRTWSRTIPTASVGAARVVVFDPRPEGIAFSAFTVGPR